MKREMSAVPRQNTLSNNPKPSLRGIPWTGVAAVGGMTACLVASAIILGVASRDDVVASWRVHPAVLLAILATTSSILFNTALAAGVAVQFWLCASRGTKLSQLHYIWAHERFLSFGSAVRSHGPARMVAVLALVANIAQFVGAPLLQRSTYQAVEYRLNTQNISMDIARQIPNGWFGSMTNNGSMVTNFDRGLALTQQWWQNSSMSTRGSDGYGCDGTCKGRVSGAGFVYHCWSTERRLELATTTTNGQTVFLVSTETMYHQNKTGLRAPLLRLTIWYVSEIDNECVGTVREEICDIESATVEYPVTIQNHTVYLDYHDLLRDDQGPRVISRYSTPGDLFKDNHTARFSGGGIGPLVALDTFARSRITDNATKRYLPASDTAQYLSPGIMSDIFFVAGDSHSDDDKQHEHDITGPNMTTQAWRSRCRLQWRRPTEYVLSAFYSFMFRAALQIGNGNMKVNLKMKMNGTETQTQTVEMRRTVPTLVFRTDSRYLVAGLVTTGSGLVLVALLLWGAWHLERPMTLSPLETASAMGAPMLVGGGVTVRRDAGIEEILERAHHIEFKIPGTEGTWERRERRESREKGVEENERHAAGFSLAV